MVQDKKDNNIIWIGTSREGLLKYDRLQKKVLQHFKNVPLLKSDNVNVMVDDGKGSLWLGSRNSLLQYVKRSGTFIKHAALPVEKYFKYRTAISKIIFSGADTLIIASSTGICSYAVRSRQYEILYINLENNADYNSSVIRSIKFDELGILWGASYKGLVRTDMHTKKSILYTLVTKTPLGVLNNVNDLIIDGKNIVLATY
jgi:ligand-binding sensor domain-containing protein